MRFDERMLGGLIGYARLGQATVITPFILAGAMKMCIRDRGGRWDQGIMQLLDAFVAFPSIVLYLVVIAALGRGDLVAVSYTHLDVYKRQVRGQRAGGGP